MFVVLTNTRYAIMDELANRQGGRGPWAEFSELDVCTIATGFGCEAVKAESATHLAEILDSVMPTLVARRSPLVVDVDVDPPG